MKRQSDSERPSRIFHDHFSSAFRHLKAIPVAELIGRSIAPYYSESPPLMILPSANLMIRSAMLK